MTSRRMLASLLSVPLLLSLACGDDPPPAELAEGIFAPMGQILPSASDAEKKTFEAGQEVALRRFTSEDGLGPLLNVTFCGACHEKPVLGGGAGRYRNFLLVGQELSDGSFTATGVNGIQSQYELSPAARHADAEDTNVTALRNPIPFFGVGLLAELPEASILAHADPDDRDDDGISGRPNYDRGFVGRFGRKAQTVSIEGFIRGPLFNHLGVTSDPLSNAMKGRLPVPSGSGDHRASLGLLPQLRSLFVSMARAQAAAPDEPIEDDDPVPDPELDAQSLFDLVAFSMLLAAPEPDEPTDQTRHGETLFAEVGCPDCHVPSLEGPRGLIPAYTDLLLHDMGDDLADGVRMGEADGREFRTQPLWGVAAVGPYLHDGQADSLHDAIIRHGGEAESARKAYADLSDDDQGDVAAFLGSLGGRTQRSDGLIPPDAPLADGDEPGAPEPGLESAQRAMFAAGRAVFDRDFAASSGLGPAFNGDSCRACHFDPVVGGAGPTDVDVTRHGIVDGDTYMDPAIGTMAHRHLLTASRAPFDMEANVTELRQTPPLFGLGRIDAIAESVLLALADPDDTDGDGVSGRAHVLADGRIGRFGWKAGVPSVAEFMRDALSNEMGIALPDQAGLTFGFGEDTDNSPDPEIAVDELKALTFYVANLAPLKPLTTPSAQDLKLFDEFGCAVCHVPELTTEGGETVPLYSDLLLHDVAPDNFVGIADGAASMREFRTPPLWGLGRTAPYMHDGRAFSVEQAIARHAAEAEASRVAYEAATASEREALLGFLESL